MAAGEESGAAVSWSLPLAGESSSGSSSHHAEESTPLAGDVSQLLGVLRARLGRASVPLATGSSADALQSLLLHADTADDRFLRYLCAADR